MFGDMKQLTTSKVISRLRTKSNLSAAHDSAMAMAVNARISSSRTTTTPAPRSDKSPGAPCHLKEHWLYTHTNGVCSKQQKRGGGFQQRNTAQPNTAHSSNLSDSEKIRRFNQLAAAGVIGFNTEVNQTPVIQQTTPAPAQSTPTNPTADCQYATLYNATSEETPFNPSVNIFTTYPKGLLTHKPTLANTACNRHMFGDAMMLDNLRDVEPVTIKVANADVSSQIVASKMGTARLHAFGVDGAPTHVDIPNVLFSPSLPANLISITQLYDDGYKSVNPHYGGKGRDLNLYFSDSKTIIPAYKDKAPGGFWRFYHFSEPCALSTATVPSPRPVTDLWH